MAELLYKLCQKMVWLPLVGFIMTVAGIVQTFDQTATHSDTELAASVIAQGIAEALSYTIAAFSILGTIIICGCICGSKLRRTAVRPEKTSPQSFTTTFGLCLLLGALGAHSFYAKRPIDGLIRLLTAGGLGMLTALDLITISAGRYKDGEGNPIIN